MNKQIKALEKLGLTAEEIAEVLADDKRIDKGEKLFELSAEQEKASKEARKADRKPTAYKFDKKEKKVDNAKRFLIQLLVSSMENADITNITIENPERELIFYYENKKYKLVLSAPRS